MYTCTPQTHIEEYKGWGTVADGPQGPRTKITQLGINIKVITIFANIKKITR